MYVVSELVNKKAKKKRVKCREFSASTFVQITVLVPRLCHRRRGSFITMKWTTFLHQISPTSSTYRLHPTISSSLANDRSLLCMIFELEFLYYFFYIFHCRCPVIVIDSKGQVRIVTGAAGGTKITTSTAFVSNFWHK